MQETKMPRTTRVYLAGGMRSNWREKVKARFQDRGDLEFFDPMTHGLTDENEYTVWDLSHVAKADVIVAYVERDNPSGIGMSVEVGFAHALGKRIIFIDESSLERRRQFGMVRSVAAEVHNSFDAWLERSGI